MRNKSGKLVRAPIIVKPSQIHGYGVFASKRILKGQTIEECPIIIFAPGSYSNASANFVFQWDDEGNSAIALGYGSVYNHATKNNAEYFKDSKNNLIKFVAARNIRKGEEIFINYSDDWFKERGIEIRIPKPESNLKRSLRLIVTLLLLLLMSFLVFFLHK